MQSFFMWLNFFVFAERGLEAYSEQTAESSHSDFIKSWGNFYVKDTGNDKYAERFLGAVQTFNSTHL